MSLAVVSPLTSLGSIFQTSGWDWTLESLIESRLSIINARPAPLISVKVILLNQSPDFHLGDSDINEYISRLFQKGDCEWHCEDHKKLGRIDGLAKSSIAVSVTFNSPPNCRTQDFDADMSRLPCDTKIVFPTIRPENPPFEIYVSNWLDCTIGKTPSFELFPHGSHCHSRM